MSKPIVGHRLDPSGGQDVELVARGVHCLPGEEFLGDGLDVWEVGSWDSGEHVASEGGVCCAGVWVLRVVTVAGWGAIVRRGCERGLWAERGGVEVRGLHYYATGDYGDYAEEAGFVKGEEMDY